MLKLVEKQKDPRKLYWCGRGKIEKELYLENEFKQNGMQEPTDKAKQVKQMTKDADQKQLQEK